MLDLPDNDESTQSHVRKTVGQPNLLPVDFRGKIEKRGQIYLATINERWCYIWQAITARKTNTASQLNLKTLEITGIVTLQMFTLGVVNSKKFALGNRFSTFSVPKEIDQPRIFCLASIWSYTVASKLEAMKSTLLNK